MNVVSLTTVLLGRCFPPNASKQPLVSLQTFVHTLLRHSNATVSIALLALIYLQRLVQRLQTSNSALAQCPRRMFLGALVLANKYHLERVPSNRAWSKLTGLPLTHINQVEAEFLALISYQLYVSPTYFSAFVRSVSL